MKMSKTSMFVTALAMSLVGWMLNGTDFHNPALNIFMGNFIGTEQADGLLISDWPLLNWLIIPVCGYIFGEYLLRVKDKKKVLSLAHADSAGAADLFPAGDSLRNGDVYAR